MSTVSVSNSKVDASHCNARVTGLQPTPESFPAALQPSSRRYFRWSLLWAICVYCFWQLLTKLVLGVIYVTLIADGLRQLIPPLGLKLYKAIPGFSFLQDYEATHRLDIAQPAALVFMVFVWIAWARLLQLWLNHDVHVADHDWGNKRGSDIDSILAAVLLVGDACLFYLSLVRVAWSGTTFSATVALATLIYVGIVVFSVLHSLRLRHRCVILSSQRESL